MKTKRIVLVILMLFQILVVDVVAADLRVGESVTLSEGSIKLVAKLEKSQVGGVCPNASWGSEQICPRRRIALLDVAFEG
jgi:hypothetical protein